MQVQVLLLCRAGMGGPAYCVHSAVCHRLDCDYKYSVHAQHMSDMCARAMYAYGTLAASLTMRVLSGGVLQLRLRL
jgi:hypothetical protein